MNVMDAITQGGRARLFGPVILMSIIAFLALIVASMLLIQQFDTSARVHEEAMIRQGFQQRIAEVAAAVVPQVNWDDAVLNLDHRMSSTWADQNLSNYLSMLNGITDIVILDPRDRPVYASSRGRRITLSPNGPFRHVIRELLPQIRAQEQLRAPFARPDPGAKTMISKPIQAMAFALVGQRPMIVTASLVQPDFGKALPLQARTSVVVTARPVDARFLEAFASRYLVRDLYYAAHRPNLRGWAQVLLTDSRGHAAGVLVWSPGRPGATLLRKLLLPLGAIAAFVLFFAFTLVRRSSAIAHDLIASEARARYLAHHDMLTQLPNRALLLDRMRQVLAMARRMDTAAAVHCLDLDRFKDVNDSLGHHAGDELIRSAAWRLASLCRDADTVARLGGDEFVILQPNTTAAGASMLANRILEAFKAPFDLEFGSVEIGCSIGVTLIDAMMQDPSEALRQADLALYRSKDNGRKQVSFFEAEMDAALKLRRSLEADLRAALAGGQLSMAYQPQVDERGDISGVEALVRWTHPQKGMVPPCVFVPLAEETGLIQELGEFVFRRVFEETRDWRNMQIAINVSAVQLRSPTLQPIVERLVRELDVDPRRYEIEITETALLGDDTLTARNLDFLKRIGCSIALDDFGTGYSSLSCLQRFAVDKIKIDRSFVNNLDASEESEALIDAIVKLARALKLDIIAEGVETEAQRSRLASCGCHGIQGYLVSKPMTAEEMRLWTMLKITRSRAAQAENHHMLGLNI